MDIDDQVVSWLTRGVKLSEDMAREAVAEIRWTERSMERGALKRLLDCFGNYGVSDSRGVCLLNEKQHLALQDAHTVLKAKQE